MDIASLILNNSDTILTGVGTLIGGLGFGKRKLGKSFAAFQAVTKEGKDVRKKWQRGMADGHLDEKEKDELLVEVMEFIDKLDDLAVAGGFNLFGKPPKAA